MRIAGLARYWVFDVRDPLSSASPFYTEAPLVTPLICIILWSSSASPESESTLFSGRPKLKVLQHLSAQHSHEVLVRARCMQSFQGALILPTPTVAPLARPRCIWRNKWRSQVTSVRLKTFHRVDFGVVVPLLLASTTSHERPITEAGEQGGLARSVFSEEN